MIGEAGQELTGRYRLAEPIGVEGRAMWTALDEWSGRPVLLTHVPMPDDPRLAMETLRMVGREVERAAGLDNPHLGRVLGAVTDDGTTLWVASEIRSGARTLREVLEAGVGAGQVGGWGHDIADGLAALHAHGLVHRDVRPGLVLIHDDGSAALAAVAATADLSTTDRDDPVADVHALVALIRAAVPPIETGSATSPEPDGTAALLAVLDRPDAACSADRLRDDLATTMARQPLSPHSWWDRSST